MQPCEDYSNMMPQQAYDAALNTDYTPDDLLEIAQVFPDKVAQRRADDMYIYSMVNLAIAGRYNEIPRLAKLFSPHVGNGFENFDHAIKTAVALLERPIYDLGKDPAPIVKKSDMAHNKWCNPQAAAKLKELFTS